MEQLLKHHWGEKQWVQTLLIGEKNGSKRHLLVDRRGAPLSLGITGAHTHDIKGLPLLLENVIVQRPDDYNENLCLDAGYVGATQLARDFGYLPHIRPRGEEIEIKDRDPSYSPKRWIVEVAHSWFNRFRKLVPRYEKTAKSTHALHHFAAAIICFRLANIH